MIGRIVRALAKAVRACAGFFLRVQYRQRVAGLRHADTALQPYAATIPSQRQGSK